jgi:5-formyltetrahydrofolate cyclo-ligase
VPAIAYDANGNRVGRGKGYYDRLLAETKATKIGVGYDFQIVDSIDAEAHDIAVDMVITDRRSITVKHHKE